MYNVSNNYIFIYFSIFRVIFQERKFTNSEVGFGNAQLPFKSKEYTYEKSVDYSKVVCPVAKSLRDQTVSLFLHPSWETDHIEKVIEAVKAVIKKHTK